MHLTIKERVELVLMSGADGVCYYYLNCFICFGALFMAHPVYICLYVMYIHILFVYFYYLDSYSCYND